MRVPWKCPTCGHEQLVRKNRLTTRCGSEDCAALFAHIRAKPKNAKPAKVTIRPEKSGE